MYVLIIALVTLKYNVFCGSLGAWRSLLLDYWVWNAVKIQFYLYVVTFICCIRCSLWRSLFCSGTGQFTKRTGVLPWHLMNSRSREIRVYTFLIALIFDRHRGSSAAEMHVKLQSDTIISWLRDFKRSCGKMSVRLVNKGPGYLLGTGTITWL